MSEMYVTMNINKIKTRWKENDSVIPCTQPQKTVTGLLSLSPRQVTHEKFNRMWMPKP